MNVLKICLTESQGVFFTATCRLYKKNKTIFFTPTYSECDEKVKKFPQTNKMKRKIKSRNF